MMIYTANPDTASMILSMDSKELEQELLKNLKELNGERVIKFENQLDYIRHVCVVRRCEKIYFRGMRHAEKGNVQECAEILAELWEYVCNYEMPVIIANEDGVKHRLQENDLMDVMRICHKQYARYLINAASRIGDEVDKNDINKLMEKNMNKTLLNLVYKNLEKARIYAEKYNVFGDDVKSELQGVWKTKEAEFRLA